MAQQEIEFVEIIADDDFRAGGKTVKKGAPFKCTKGTAKQLVAADQAHYPTEDEQAVEDEKPADDGKADDGKKAPASTAKKSEPAKS